jgi:hypothetical protein
MNEHPFDLLSEKFKHATSHAEMALVLEQFMDDLELLIPGAAAWPIDELTRYLNAHPHDAQQLTRLTLASKSARVVN